MGAGSSLALAALTSTAQAQIAQVCNSDFFDDFSCGVSATATPNIAVTGGSTAVGDSASASAASTAVGNFATAVVEGTAVGRFASATNDAIAVGTSASANGVFSI